MAYENYHVNVSEGQRRRIKQSYADGNGIRIQFSYDDLNNGDDLIALTKSQVKKMKNALQRNKGVVIEMSSSQVKANLKMEGGFLGALLGLAARFLPTIAKTLLPGIAMGAASAGIEKAIKGTGLYMKRGGSMCSVETEGKGLYLRKVTTPRGISPFKNIPLLGAIL